MEKIGSFIYEMDKMLMRKCAFVPAQAAGGGPQMKGQTDQLMQQIQQKIQALPPEQQQQAMQQLQQVQSLPPEQQQQVLQQVSQGLDQQAQQGAQGGGQQPQQPGQPQGTGGPPGQQGQPQDPNQQGQPGNPSAATNQDGSANTNGHMQAENQLDNTKVTLSVRELMDITSKGGASEALFKVKQLAGQHNQKMQGQQQKMQQDQQQAAMDQQAAQSGMQSGGLYAQAPDMSGKGPGGGGGGQPQPAQPGM